MTGFFGPAANKRFENVEGIMLKHIGLRLSFAKQIGLAAAGVAVLMAQIAVGILDAPSVRAQDQADWQSKAGAKMTFEVASVKLSTEKQFVPPSMPLDAGDRYHPTGDYFRADFPLWSYIQFAYKLWAPAEDQRKEIVRLPRWVTTDRYSIEARAAGTPTKDQFRLMVQSLLADRFMLAAHFEIREVPALTLTLVKAGKLGPKLIREDAGPENYPPMCDSLVLIRRPNGMMLAGYRNVTMDQLAGSLSGIIGLGHTLVDRTGLSGRFDFTLAWAPEPTAPPPSDAPTTPPDPLGPTPVQALRDQLGLKLESARGPVKILVIDHVDRPSEN
jgi:uncharacterized protein (TIGR03435 family)